jgi:O-antigen chain-terminating methyltransferase
VLLEAENDPNTAVSDSEDAVAALVARLKEEVRQAPRLDISDGYARSLVRQRLRLTAERYWPLTAERPLGRRPGVRSVVVPAVKRVLRKLMRWYVEPVAADQRAFNGAALKLVDELFEEVDALFRRLEQAEAELGAERERTRLVEELELRLTRLERRRGSDSTAVTPVTVAAQPGQAALPDYFSFESRMRGTFDEIRRRQAPYVDDFRGLAPVLDIGCGRGELLTLLREAGIEARGVDADADMVSYARGEGLDVEHVDLFTHLETLDDASLGGIFAGQVVEHLPPASLLRLLELARTKLRSGGLLVCETINPLSPLALRNYFADLTHAQPLVPETLVLLATQAGFTRAETRYLNRPVESERLRGVELPDGPEFDPARASLARNLERLNDLLFGPLDYAVLASV